MANCNWVTIMQNGWFEDVKDVYGKEFPWEIRSTLSSWLARDDSFMSFDPNEPSHHAYIFAFIDALIIELRKCIDVPTSPDDSYYFLFKQRLLKLFKRAKMQDRMHLFQVIRDTLTCEKQKVEELAASRAHNSRTVPSAIPVEKSFSQIKHELDNSLMDIRENCTKIEQSIPEISNRYSTLQYNLYMLQQQQNIGVVNGNGYAIPDNVRILSAEEFENDSTRFNQDMQAVYQTMGNIMVALPEVHSKVLKELETWLDDQRLVALGKPVGSRLENIEKWSRSMSDCFDILEQKLPVYKTICQNQNFRPEYINNVQAAIDRVRTLRENTINISLAISKEPKQIIRTNTNFGPVKMVVLPFCANMMITSVNAVFINYKTAAEYFNKSDRSKLPTKSGELKFGKGGLKVAGNKIEYQTMTVSKVLKTSKRGEQFVVEEKFCIYFRVTVNWNGRVITLHTTSLPISVTSHPVQEGKAWTHVLWYNAFPVQSRLHFQVPEEISWSNLIEAIDLAFLNLGKRLSDDQKNYLKDRIFMGCIPNNDMVSKSRFCYDVFATGKVDPETSEDGKAIKNYSFGEWLFCCIKILAWAPKNAKLAKYGLKHFWKEGKIEGFMSKEKLETSLQGTTVGTFIIRFPENMPDCIALYFYNNSANPREKLLKQLLTIKDFNMKALQDRILDSKVATYLYPSTKKEDAFTRMFKTDTSIVNGYFTVGLLEDTPREVLESVKINQIEQNVPSPLSSHSHSVLSNYSYSAHSPSTESVQSDFSSTAGSRTSYSPDRTQPGYLMEDFSVVLDGIDPLILFENMDL